MSAYDAALTMYHREHDRWHQWALFFFAGVGATFYVASQFDLPLWCPSIAAAVVSVMWALAASSIRATTDAWQSTLLHFEANPDARRGAFQTFRHELERFDYLSDLKQTLRVWQRATLLSVTRLLVLSGLVAFILFVCLAVADATGIIS